MAISSRTTLKNLMNRDLNKSGQRKKVANFTYSAYQYIRDLIDSVVFADGSPSETAVAWDDLRVPAQNTRLNPTKSEPEFAVWLDGLYAFHFKPTNADDESLHFAAQLPHSYKEGTDIDCHVHWSPDNTDTGDVVWELEYTFISINGTFPASTTVTAVDAADGVDNKHQLTAITDIDGTGIGISAMLVGRLTRLTSDIRDDFTGNAILHEIDFHFQKDSIGSRQETVK